MTIDLTSFTLGILTAGLCFLVGSSLYRYLLTRSQETSSINAAKNIVASHGYMVHRYFAGINQHQQLELKNALSQLGDSGYLITDETGNLVGKVA